MGTIQQEYEAIKKDHAECHRLLNSAGEEAHDGRLSGRLQSFIARQSELLDVLGKRIYVLENETDR